MKKIVAVITARSGSKGIPNKNLSVVAGKTLIEHAVLAGLSSKLISEVYISTDSADYESVALNAGAKSLGLRDSQLSSDTAKSSDVLIAFCSQLGLEQNDIVVLLQPTSPIRSGKLIDEAIGMTLENGQSTVSVSEVDEPNPYKLKKIVDGVIVPFLPDFSSEIPRQLLPKAYQLTGAVYVSSVKNLKEKASLFSEHTNPLIQPEFVNIDSKDDLDYLNYLVDFKKVRLY